MINEGDTRVQWGIDGAVLKHRAEKSPLAPYTVKLTGVKAIQAAWRDHVHAVLWDNLTRCQQDAWQDIVEGFNAVTGIMHARAMDHSMAGGQNTRGDDYGAAIQADYKAWANRVRHRRLDFDMVIGIIAEGRSLSQAARMHRMRKHMARLILTAALDIYSEMRGWR